MKISTSKQSGFTLVEIAIVLVIIGVLLAGVLKGQSLINNSRIKGLVNNMNAVSSAYNAYIDRYQVIPGTELSATVNTKHGWVTTADGAAPLALPPGAGTFTNAGSQQAFWQVLKAAGFYAGTAGDTTNPASATGGLIGVAISPYALTGISACMNNVAVILAEGVDIVTDGALPAPPLFANSTGSLRATAAAVSGAVPIGAPYNEASGAQWNICRTL